MVSPRYATDGLLGAATTMEYRAISVALFATAINVVESAERMKENKGVPLYRNTKAGLALFAVPTDQIASCSMLA